MRGKLKNVELFKGNTTISENFCDACIILRNSYVTIARSIKSA